MASDPTRLLTAWDFGIIGVYVVFISSIGFICRKLNKNASDYFRGGGNMVWWVGGASAFAAGISTWSFTGGAAKCYQDGFVYPITQLVSSIPTLFVLLWLAPRFRRFRVITALEAVYRRYGFTTEQFYTWVSLPMGLFWGGIGLNSVGVFMASAFHIDLRITIIVVGTIVTLLSTLGGQWAVAMGGVVQGVLLLLVVLVVTFFSVNLPEIGGLSHLLSVLPPRHLHFSYGTSSLLVWGWIGWNCINNTLMQMDMRNCSRFVRVQDDRSAKQMVLLMAAPSILLLLPIVMQLPSICAAKVFPDLHSVFPNLTQPAEGAWVAMAFKVLPQGLLGLMVCAMFSAATDSADAALNSNAGFFVRNIYIRYLHREASDRRQGIVGKLTTVVFGVLFIGLGLYVNSLRTLNLFDLFQLLNAVLFPPMITPMVLGIFIRRSPSWAGWSTVIWGLMVSLSAKAIFSSSLAAALLHVSRPLTTREFDDAQAIFVAVVSWLGATAWFLATVPFWRTSNVADHSRIGDLFSDLSKPVVKDAVSSREFESMQYHVIGSLFCILGVILLLCMLIPNPIRGRVSFAFVGGVLTLIGLLLRWLAARSARPATDHLPNQTSTTEFTTSAIISHPFK